MVFASMLICGAMVLSKRTKTPTPDPVASVPPIVQPTVDEDAIRKARKLRVDTYRPATDGSEVSSSIYPAMRSLLHARIRDIKMLQKTTIAEARKDPATVRGKWVEASGTVLQIQRAACGWSDVELIKRVAAGGKAKRIAITDEPARYGLMAA